MHHPTYDFWHSEDAQLFEFENISVHKRIKQVFEYARLTLPGEVFNLGLFDVT